MSLRLTLAKRRITFEVVGVAEVEVVLVDVFALNFVIRSTFLESLRYVTLKRFLTTYVFTTCITRWPCCVNPIKLKILKKSEKWLYFNKLDRLQLRKILTCITNALAYQCKITEIILLALYNWVITEIILLALYNWVIFQLQIIK